MIPTRKLKTGDEIPVIAYGTWDLNAEAVEKIDNIDQEKRIYMITLDDETYGIRS